MENTTEQKNTGSNTILIIIGVVILAVAGFVYAQYNSSETMRDERDNGDTMMGSTDEDAMMEGLPTDPDGDMASKDTSSGATVEESDSGAMMEATDLPNPGAMMGASDTAIEAGAMMEVGTQEVQ